jgi:hypothetical protein
LPHDPSLHEPPAQTGLFGGHTVPQVPQFWLSLGVSAQNGVPPSGRHFFWIGEHVDLHAPSMHDSSTPHFLPQSPQFALSVCRFTHDAMDPPSGAQKVWSGEHELWHTPPTQASVGAHGTPHLPQLALSVLRSVQYGAPPSGMHIVLPVEHEELQPPPMHASVLLQAFPHAPQFLLSVLELTHVG